MEKDCVMEDPGGSGLARFGFRITRIEEARAVSGPSEGGVPSPADLVVQNNAGSDVEHSNRTPVRAAALNAISDVRAAVGHGPFGQRIGAVARPRIRVNQHPIAGIRAFPHPQGGLVVSPLSTSEEV